jgi:hypothetical protein
VLQHQFAVTLHQRVDLRVFHHHQLVAERGGAAGAHTLADLQAFYGLVVAGGQVGRGAQVQLAVLQQQDGAQAVRRAVFDQAHDGVQRLRQRRAAGDQAQHLLLRPGKIFRGLQGRDVVEHRDAAYQRAGGIVQRAGADAQHAVFRAGPAQHQVPVVDADAARGP